jgi:lipopolysaccharide biosynthesis glycosyltransferase
MKKEIIPVMFCFDTNYVIPASVAFYSLMEHADKKFYYKFYILHTDITIEQQKKLNQTIKPFKENVELVFIDMENKFEDIWKKVKSKVHFSKEVLYKLLVASLFPQYNKIIVSDVDVVFLGDISKSYFCINENDDYYLAGVKQVGYLKKFNNVYNKSFSKEEIKKLNGFCGGFLVFNLKKLRVDNMEQQYISCLEKNSKRIVFAEQDILNLCSKNKIYYLPLNYVTCSYLWDFYKKESDYNKDGVFTKEEIKDAMKNPIQLHYASKEKPWKYPDYNKCDIWFKYVVQTPFLQDFLNQLPYTIIPKKNKTNKIIKIIYIFFNYIKHIIKYFIYNPLFIFKKSFYTRIYNKFIKKNKQQKNLKRRKNGI